ncbi:hypothetical protein RQN31_29005, partial [Citrobacter freundii]|nr:hypothetical protein [Citrobacter freundii]
YELIIFNIDKDRPGAHETRDERYHDKAGLANLNELHKPLLPHPCPTDEFSRNQTPSVFQCVFAINLF